LSHPILSSQRRRMVAQRAWGNHLIFFSQRKNNYLKNTRRPILFTSHADEDSKTQKELLCLPTLFTSHANKRK
jgi:hypothetical protein